MRLIQPQDRRWWFGVGIIVVVGAGLRFTGYQYALPYFDHMDEPWFFYEAAYQRGLMVTWLHPNPSPALIYLYKWAQIITERITGQLSLNQAAQIFAMMRFISVILSLVTLVFIALCGREMAGKKAGWLAALVWALIPLVIYHSFIAIAEPWMMLLAAVTFYTAVRGIQSNYMGFAIASVWAGLLAFAFKYSMFPLAGVGLVVVVWRILREIPRRRYWLRALLIQFSSIVGFLLFLVLFEGLAQSIINPSREVAVFFDNPLVRLLDVGSVAAIFTGAFRQFGTHVIVFVIVYASALIVLIRTHQPAYRLVLWVLFGLLGSFLALLVPLYLMTDATLERYWFAANLTFVIVGASSLAVIYDTIASHVHTPQRKRVLAVAAAGGLIVWLTPLAAQSLSDAYARTKPQTLTDLTVWASNTLSEGGILIEGAASRAFSREFGGSWGLPHQQLVGYDLLSKSPDEWIRGGYQYVQMTQAQEAALLEEAEGRAYLAGLLELRRFPPPESSADWGGIPFVVYQFDRPDSATDVSFGDTFQLVGCECDTAEIKRGDRARFRFYWRALRVPTANYSMFLHIRLADSDTLLAQVDGGLGPPNRPTLTWVFPSETMVSEPMFLDIPSDLPHTARLVVGVYEQQSGQRLTTVQGDGYLLAQLNLSGDSD